MSVSETSERNVMKWREKNESEESTKFTGFYILLRIITGGDLIIY